MFILNAFVSTLFGIWFLAMPNMALKQFGVDEYASTELTLRFFGTALLTVGLLAYFVRNVADADTQRGLAWGFFLGTLTGLVVSIIGTFTGVIRILGWLAIVIYVLFGLGYGFMLFLKPRMKE
jgi:hypothetical protein